MDELCDLTGDWRYIDIAMRDWQRTHSHVGYWSDRMRDYKRLARTLRLDETKLIYHDIYSFNMSYGLPTEDMVEVCKATFSNNIAKLTIQVVDPDVMVIKKGLKVSFTDQIGVIGKLSLAKRFS